MGTYPGSEKERRIPADTLKKVVQSIFQRCGMSAEDAELLTETLVVADLRGVHSHGVMRVPNYVKRLQTGVNPKGRPRVVKDTGAALVIHGGNSMGQIGSTFAMRQVIERARTTGVAVAAVGGSNHCGAMAYYTMMALPEDMIGLATTNALPTMAPWGGIDRILGINPLSVAIPAGEEIPIVYDAAFSYSARGKIEVYHQKGLQIPSTWAFDAEGRPTTDPAKALEGLLQPIGEYKGTSLALIMGILSAVLSGASYGTELGDLEKGAKAGQDGHFFMALKIAAFEDVARFKQRVDGIIRQIRHGRKAPGFDRIYSPGELEAETEIKYRKEGIPLNEDTLKGIITAAEQLGVDASPIRS
ncbi:MAG TPA: Ldh family oxidoreductase [Candidatus Limnocylindrales bacterium]|nr:Ldh family oxidoreductase [Candidatus Limnocylindrales bacterium]